MEAMPPTITNLKNITMEIYRVTMQCIYSNYVPRENFFATEESAIDYAKQLKEELENEFSKTHSIIVAVYTLDGNDKFVLDRRILTYQI